MPYHGDAGAEMLLLFIFKKFLFHCLLNIYKNGHISSIFLNNFPIGLKKQE